MIATDDDDSNHPHGDLRYVITLGNTGNDFTVDPELGTM